MEIPRVLVLMPTYNGEKYLAEQIESILNQKDVAVSLWIQDDKSKDGTVQVVQNFVDQYENVSLFINEENLGCAENFIALLDRPNPADFDYYAMSDQDDYWDPEKLIAAIIKMKSVESSRGKLYCGLTANGDENLQNAQIPVQDYVGYASSPYNAFTFNRFAGCTMVFDPQMLELIQRGRFEWPRYRTCYDFWVYNIAVFAGTPVHETEKAYITRRVHGNNVSGYETAGMLGKLKFYLTNKNIWKFFFSKTRPMFARELLARYPELISETDKEQLTLLAGCAESLDGRFAAFRHIKTGTPESGTPLSFRIRALLGWL